MIILTNIFASATILCITMAVLSNDREFARGSTKMALICGLTYGALTMNAFMSIFCAILLTALVLRGDD